VVLVEHTNYIKGKTMQKLIFFGDSICTGQYISIHKGWVSRLSESLYGQLVVLNSSVNGRTTRQALGDMPYHIQEQHPDFLVIQFGMNDCNYWESDRGVPRVSPKSFEANLEEIINRAFAFKVKKIFLNTNHPTKLNKTKIPYTKITYEDSNKQYNTIIRKVAKNNNVILNDIEPQFIKKDAMDLLLPDLLHPSEQGHKLYFDIISPVIEKEIFN
jgi:acyl-CoA thioesterase I